MNNELTRDERELLRSTASSTTRHITASTLLGDFMGVYIQRGKAVVPGTPGRWPQAYFQPSLQSRQRKHIRPTVAPQKTGDGGPGHPSEGLDATQSLLCDFALQAKSHDANGLNRSELGRNVRPIGHQFGWRRTPTSTHEGSVWVKAGGSFSRRAKEAQVNNEGLPFVRYYGQNGGPSKPHRGKGDGKMDQKWPSAESMDALHAYTPTWDNSEWKAIREFTLKCLFDYLPNAEGRHLTQLGHFAAYVRFLHFSADVPLERETVLDPDMVGYYIKHAMKDYAPSTRTVHRAALLRMGDYLLPNMRRLVRMESIGRSPSASPYTATEIQKIRRWAMAQSTAYRRHSAWTVAAYALGAGLRAGEIASLLREDVNEDESGVLVNVRHGDYPRTVPVLAEWENEAIVLAQCVTSSGVIYRSGRIGTDPVPSRGVGAWLARMSPESFPITGTRMRSTWIIKQLSNGIPANVMIQVAGVKSYAAFDRYLPWVDETSWDQVREEIRLATNRDAIQQRAYNKHAGRGAFKGAVS